MKPFDFNQRQRATWLTFPERILAQILEKRERLARLLALSQQLQIRSRQQIAASRELLRRPLRSARHEAAGDAGGSGLDRAVHGSAGRETGQLGWDGRPDAPERSAWHWIEDGDGLRPVLWRGEDWPAPPDQGVWQDGHAVLAPGGLGRARYHGPLALPGRSALSRQGSADQGG